MFLDIVIRLVGGSSYNEGRVEVYYNGEWGTVCDDGWYYRSTYVVCRQLGFGTSGSSYRGAYFGQGTGPIWLDNVVCTGSETTLASCGHLGFKIIRSCGHYEDMGVRCYGSQGIIIAFESERLYAVLLYITKVPYTNFSDSKYKV